VAPIGRGYAGERVYGPSAGQGSESFDGLLYERLDATLGEYLGVLEDRPLP